MYRPNRIGPWPLVHVDKNPVIHTGANMANRIDTFPAESFIVPDATIRTNTASRTQQIQTMTLSNNKTFSIGVALNGANPYGAQATDGERGFHLSVCGAIAIKLTSVVVDFPVVALPFVARATNATLALSSAGNNPFDDYFLVPANSIQQAANYQVTSFNTSLVMGQYDGDDTYDSDPLYIGFLIRNLGVADENINLECSVSAHKFIKDLDTYDPPRN